MAQAQGAAESEAAKPVAKSIPWPAKDAAFRVWRWFFYSVILSVFPVLISFLWLPRKTSVSQFLSHGDLAVIACALFGVSLGEIFGSSDLQKQRWLREVLMGASTVSWSASLLLLSCISGNATQVTPDEDAKYSWYLLIAAVIIGIAVFAATVSRSSERK